MALMRKHEQQLSHDSRQGLIVDSYIAMTNYWLQPISKVDPVELASEKEFEFFYSWIWQKIQQESIFERPSFVKKLKKQITGARAKSAGLSVVIHKASQQASFMCRWLAHRYLGARLPKKLTREWANYP